MADMMEMQGQYRLALVMWHGFESGLSTALPNIRNRSQLMAFRNGPWRQLSSLHQQAGLYWEIAEDEFQKVELVGSVGESLDRLRQMAWFADQKAGVVIEAFLQLCDYLDRSPTVPQQVFTEIFKVVNEQNAKINLEGRGR